jgi:Mn2+/Fe2+ NRAMP family transporter
MTQSSKQSLLKTLGPGLLFAAAAVGVSHLVQSTRAGALYGTNLIVIVILVNLFKYPFFEFAQRWTGATGENMIDGYRKLGKWALTTYFIMSGITSFITVAAVSLVTAAISGYSVKVLTGIELSTRFSLIILYVVSLSLLFFGKYKMLDKVVKYLVAILSFATVFAMIAAMLKGSNAMPDFVAPELLSGAGIAFLISLMGWMPAPIEVSVWPSLWSAEQTKQLGYRPDIKNVLFDFNFGYIITAILAVCFLALGALVMYGTGEEFSAQGVAFSAQLIGLYSKTLGSWTLPIITTIATITMISTTITVFDAYPRVLGACYKNIVPNSKTDSDKIELYITFALVVASIFIIEFFTSGMTYLIDIATFVSFVAGPIYAVLNYKLVNSSLVPQEFRPKKWLNLLALIGILFFVAFTAIYILSMYTNPADWI